ncbi:MAG: hypothetical protein WB460_09775 [Candidatus Acidiferrales bacterium]
MKHASKAKKTKADTVSASKPTREFDRRTDLTPNEEKVVRQFVEKGKATDRSVSELLSLATKVKAIFASKVRGIPVHFEGRPYMTFDSFVDANLPICGRSVRRLLAEQGQTDQRFANKKQPKLLEIAVTSKSEPPKVAKSKEKITEIIEQTEARIRSAVGIPHGEPLPENLIKAYEAGYRYGYGDALATADKLKGLA